MQTLQHRSMDITTLIEIGVELGWFSTIPDEVLAEFDGQELALLKSKVPLGESLTAIAPLLAKNSRNMLHPAKHLRDGQGSTTDELLDLGMGFMTLALTAFVLSQSK